MTKKSARHPLIAPLFILLLAFFLRVWQLSTTPPGWRDDELINSLVISQKVLDGDLAVYYADASGHEALYHALNAIMLGLFGPNFLGIRYLSALLSVLTVALTYRLGRFLFNNTVGLLAAAALALSFWSLMYGRIGLRHVLTPPLAMLAFYFFWRALRHRSKLPVTNYLLAALFMALGLYTYFAARGVPLILLAFCLYITVFVRGVFRQQWRRWLLMFGLTAVLALPLFLTLQQQPDAEGRVAELAVPLTAARGGNFKPLAKYTLTTLGMFHATGDSEWLYNIANRPIFGPIAALCFWLGVLIALKSAFDALRLRPSQPSPSIFLLLWWLAGISPAFISVPPASLGHTILAQPATFLLLALPFGKLKEWQGHSPRFLPLIPRYLLPILAILLLATVAWRDLGDYFTVWPQRGLVRFLYRADYADIADYLDQNANLTDFGVTGLLAGPWDKMALQIDAHTAVRPRWYNAERVLLVQPSLSFYGFPDPPADFASAYNASGVQLGGFQLGTILANVDTSEPICFTNGLCVLQALYDADQQQLDLTWQVQRPLTLPPIPLISNPPPPGVYAGLRLSVFAQLLDGDGQFLSGDDGFWLDPTTLHEGDIFIQRHYLPTPSAGQTLAFGLYDPMTNERILTEDGRDALLLGAGE